MSANIILLPSSDALAWGSLGSNDGKRCLGLMLCRLRKIGWTVCGCCRFVMLVMRVELFRLVHPIYGLVSLHVISVFSTRYVFATTTVTAAAAAHHYQYQRRGLEALGLCSRVPYRGGGRGSPIKSGRNRFRCVWEKHCCCFVTSTPTRNCGMPRALAYKLELN